METSLPSESGHPRKNLYNCSAEGDEMYFGESWKGKKDLGYDKL